MVNQGFVATPDLEIGEFWKKKPSKLKDESQIQAKNREFRNSNMVNSSLKLNVWQRNCAHLPKPSPIIKAWATL